MIRDFYNNSEIMKAIIKDLKHDRKQIENILIQLLELDNSGCDELIAVCFMILYPEVYTTNRKGSIDKNLPFKINKRVK